MIRVIIALLIALIGATIIWLVVPYNNYFYNNSYISDSYLPEMVILLLLVLVLAINPILRLLGRGMMLDRHQLALIAGLLLFAAVIPGNGLMRMFPRFVAESNVGFNQGVTTSKIAAEANFPQALFPDPLPTINEAGELKTEQTPYSDTFLDLLGPDQTIPWQAWALPLTVWAGLMCSIWLMMLGLGGVVFPQWRDRERLPFPLLNVYQSLTGSDEETDEHRTLPRVFYSRSFWIAVGAVFLIHLFRGLHEFTGAFPTFPLDWNLSPYLTDTFFDKAPAYLKRQQILFMLVGVAYFVPNRYAVSVWGWVVGYSIYDMFGKTYIPAFSTGHINDNAFGVLLAIVLWTIWLGRNHWWKVGAAMFGRVAMNPESRRDMIAGWMFVLGCAGMVLWLAWAGVAIWWGILMTIGAAMISLLMARIIAETGLPVLWLNRFAIGTILAFFPLSWQSPAVLYFSSVLYAIFTRGSAVSAAVMTTLAVGVDREATANRQTRMLVFGMLILVIGFFVASAVHLNMGYRSDTVTTDPKLGARAIDPWALADTENYEFFTASRGQQFGGLAVGATLLWACSRFPSWPIHPVGIIFLQFSIGLMIWFSIFLGWLIKVTVTNLFGGGAYRKARPFFLGLIMGELIALILWAIIPLVIIWWTGAEPSAIPRYTLIRYP